MQIAVTGASGFIGGHVRKVISKSGHEIVLVSRKPESLKPMAANETVIKIDFHRSNNDWFTSLGQPDVVLHLAWSGLPNYLDSYHVQALRSASLLRNKKQRERRTLKLRILKLCLILQSRCESAALRTACFDAKVENFKTNSDFRVRNLIYEKLLISAALGGYLKRVR